ncbi:hypothetical protein SCALM49S_08555 [Streptomyces californicus]
MPSPGVKSTPESMSAIDPRPSARSASIACAFVVPSGIPRPTTPAKIRSVAMPRIFGPATDSATLTATAASIRYSDAFSCPNRLSSRLPDPLKSIDRSVGAPPAIIRPPGPAITRPPLPSAGRARSPGTFHCRPSARDGSRHPTTRPSSSTRIRSASRMVDTRCATITTVAPAVSRPSAARSAASVA